MFFFGGVLYIGLVFTGTTRGLSDRPLDPFGLHPYNFFEQVTKGNRSSNYHVPNCMYGGSPKVSKGNELPVGSRRRRVSGAKRRRTDRKALWSPVRAKPHFAQQSNMKGKTYIKTIPQALQGLG